MVSINKLPTSKVDKKDLSFTITANPYFDNTIASYMITMRNKVTKANYEVTGSVGHIVDKRFLVKKGIRNLTACPKRFLRTSAKSFIDDLPDTLVVFTGEPNGSTN